MQQFIKTPDQSPVVVFAVRRQHAHIFPAAAAFRHRDQAVEAVKMLLQKIASKGRPEPGIRPRQREGIVKRQGMLRHDDDGKTGVALFQGLQQQKKRPEMRDDHAKKQQFRLPFLCFEIGVEVGIDDPRVFPAGAFVIDFLKKRAIRPAQIRIADPGIFEERGNDAFGVKSRGRTEAHDKTNVA